MPGETSPAVLMTVHAADGPPSLEQAAEQLALKVEDLDRDYGVVTIDPERGVFSVLAHGGCAPEAAPAGGGFEGPWSNPSIAPYGPPETDPDR